MNKGAPPKIVLHMPQDKGDLICKRAAQIQADFVVEYIEHINCPERQKEELLQAIIDTVNGLYEAKNEAEERKIPPNKQFDG